jgi:hypothetical protein
VCSARLAAVLTLLLVLAGGNGCAGDDCLDVDCTGEDVSVSWHRAEIPAAASYRLCVHDVCERVEPREWSDNRLMVGLDTSSPDDVVARLDLLDAAGEIEQTFEGRGSKSGTCCRAALFTIGTDGQLIPEE